MRLLPIVKGTLQKFKSRKTEEPTTPNEQADGFHTTPAGEFPRNGPKSSIVACIMFYLSKIITIIGLILVARAVWFEEVSGQDEGGSKVSVFVNAQYTILQLAGLEIVSQPFTMMIRPELSWGLLRAL